MNKFDTPEIKVVVFAQNDVITTSAGGGFEQNQSSGSVMSSNVIVDSGIDTGYPL